MPDLSGRVALVTGASSGIGQATARALAAEGARVVLAARRSEPLQDLVQALSSSAGEAVAVPTDVRERAQLVALVDAAIEEFGGLDILVNNAGIGPSQQMGVAGGDLDEWRAAIAVNLVGLMELTHLAGRVFLDQGHGHVVNISSGAGRFGFPEIPSYVASKFGVNGFTAAVRRDLVPKGIRVTLIEPGEVDTPMQEASEQDRAQMLRPEDIADTIVYAVSRPPHVNICDVLVAPAAFNPSDDYG